MKRIALLLGVTGAAAASAVVPTVATADPPQPPPGCGVVVGTAAFTTGSVQGFANKVATYTRVCLGG